MWNFLLWIFIIILLVLSPFAISMLIHFLYFYFVKDMRFKKGEYQYVGYGSKLKRLFVEFPRQFVLDSFNRDPDWFRDYGVHMIARKAGKWQEYYTYIYAFTLSEDVSTSKSH